MTDGAARLCEQLLGQGPQAPRGGQHRQPADACSRGGLQGQAEAPGGGQDEQLGAELGEAFRRLTSQDPALFWTSGQVSKPAFSVCLMLPTAVGLLPQPLRLITSPPALTLTRPIHHPSTSG